MVKEAFLFAIPGLQFEWVVCGGWFVDSDV